MTQRLAIAMLATVWAILIAAGVTAYVTTRSVLVENLDAALLARATPLDASNRYSVKNDLGQTVQTRANLDSPASYAPVMLRAAFGTLGDGQRVRIVSVRKYQPNEAGEMLPVTVTMSESAEPLDRLLSRLAWALIISGCAGGLIAAMVARWVAKVTLRPLHSTAEAIGAIDEKNLSRRIDSTKLAPELLPVAERLNEMLARLEVSFANRKQFIADASHELRTPVAAMVTTLEVSLRRIRDAESYRQTMEICLSDARLLRMLVDALMAQARSEIAVFDEPVEQTDISQLLHECAVAQQAAAGEKNISLNCSIEASINLPIQPARLRQAVLGLLENAIEHNQRGGKVALLASTKPGQLQISVEDNGSGIAAEHLPRLFEPFYRVSKARDVSGHMGLGLHLIKTHIESLGGTCAVSSEVGVGSVFSIVLPITNRLASATPSTGGKPIATVLAG